MGKKIIAYILILAIVFSIASFPVFADGDSSGTPVLVSLWNTLWHQSGADNVTFLEHILSSLGLCPGCSSSDSEYHEWQNPFYIGRTIDSHATSFWDSECIHCGMLLSEYLDCESDYIDEDTTEELYQDYVSTLPASTVNSDGSFVWYLPHLRCSFDICYNGNRNLSTGCSCSHSPYSTHSDFYQGDYGNYSITHNSDSVIVTCYPANGASSVKAEWPSFYWQGAAPVSGLYSLQPDTYFYASNSSSMSSPYVLSASSVHYSEGASISRTYELERNYGCSADYIYKLTAYTPKYLVTPDTAFDITSGDTYNIDNRVSNYVTNYSYDGDCIEHQIINETNNTYYSPITNETYEMDGWSYDYSTRTYYTNYNTDNSSTVTYGDEYITVTEGSTTNNYYYYITNTGGGGSDDPSGDSSTLIEWLETFKTWLGGKLDGMGGTTVNVNQVIEDNEIEISDSDSEDADGLLDMVKALVEGVVSITVKSINVVVSGSDSLTTRLTGVGSFIGLFNPSNQSGVFYHPLPSASPSPGVS